MPNIKKPVMYSAGMALKNLLELRLGLTVWMNGAGLVLT
jgi:hypothetical protein